MDIRHLMAIDIVELLIVGSVAHKSLRHKNYYVLKLLRRKCPFKNIIRQSHVSEMSRKLILILCIYIHIKVVYGKLIILSNSLTSDDIRDLIT